MIQEIIARLFEVALFCGIAAGFAGILMAGVYDLQRVARLPGHKAATQKLAKKTAQPAVTVLVYVRNDAETIVGCLESLTRSRYRNYDIVVVDNLSEDYSRKTIRRYIKEHPELPIYLYAKRKRDAKTQALRQAYRKSRQGELVLTLAASSRPSHLFLRESVARMLVEPALGGVRAHESSPGELGIIDLVPEVGAAMRNIFLKSLSLLGMRHGSAGLNALYDKARFLGVSRAAVRYESALLLHVVREDRQPDDVAMVAPAVTILLLMTYAMAMAATLVSYVPLLLAWFLVAVGSLAAVWFDEASNTMQKIQLTSSAMLLFFLWYVAVVEFLLQQIVKSIRPLFEPVSLPMVWRLR